MRKSKRASGMYVAIVGPNTFAPIVAHCKKQACASHSSTESEIVAAELAVRSEGLQILTFWEHVALIFGDKDPDATVPKKTDTKGLVEDPLSQHYNPLSYFLATEPGGAAAIDTRLIIAEDNEAVIKIVSKGRSPQLRHLPRTHRIDVNWPFEVCSSPRVLMRYVHTSHQIADMFTKAITKVDTWIHLLDLAQIRQGPILNKLGTPPQTTPDIPKQPKTDGEG